LISLNLTAVRDWPPASRARLFFHPTRDKLRGCPCIPARCSFILRPSIRSAVLERSDFQADQLPHDQYWLCWDNQFIAHQST
jgi:hypothetical protein